MATVRNFLGTDLEIPEDRRYNPAGHLWFRAVNGVPQRRGARYHRCRRPGGV